MNVNGLFFKPEELESIKLSSSSQLQELNGMIIQQLVQWMKFYKIKSVNMSLSSVGVTTSPDIVFADIVSKNIPIPEGIKRSKVFVLRNVISNLMLLGGVRSISIDIDTASIEEVNLVWEKMVKRQSTLDEQLTENNNANAANSSSAGDQGTLQ